ncbi:MAG: hypothetical protein RR053_06225 [Evtepia sp.]
MSEQFTLPIAVSTLAASIAKNLSDDNLALTAAILTQLGDTLATIAVLRAYEQKEGRQKKSIAKQESG